MDEVGGVRWFQSGAELLLAVQRLHDLFLPAIALLAECAEEHGRFGIGVCCATEHVVEVVGSLVDLGSDGSEAGEDLVWIGFIEECGDAGALRHCDGFVVACDGHVHQHFQNPKLRGEQPIDRRFWDVRASADGRNGGHSVTTLKKELACCVDHRSPCEPRSGLFSSRRTAVDSTRHKMILSLSIRASSSSLA